MYIEGVNIDSSSYYTIQHDLPIQKVAQRTLMAVLGNIFEKECVSTSEKKVARMPLKMAHNWTERVDNIKRQVAVSRFFRYTGVVQNGRLWDTPFGISTGKKCVDIDDKQGLFFDFNGGFGGDLITAAKKYWGCSFATALTKLEDEFGVRK
jgi:hypothetical protein